MPAADANRNKGAMSSSGPIAVDALALNQLSLIKINQNASARDVVRGAEGTLWRLRPAVFATVADASQQIAFHEQMVTFGYRCWRVETPLFIADNFNRRRENAFGGQTAFAVLAIPEELEIELPPACDEIR
jgi:hypothetical protein